MYLPMHFKEERLPMLHGLIRAQPLATLVTLSTGGLTADHVPLLLDAERGAYGTLVGHVARANPLWKDHQTAVDALAVFTGPDSYISPSFYPTKRKTGMVVPTWNYVAVHAWGKLNVHDDANWLRDLVSRLTDHHESAGKAPWRVTDAPADFIDKMLKAIVGIEIPIHRIEGKWKVSQNRPAADREGTIAGLHGAGTPQALEMAELVAETHRAALERGR
jgi:transcriptional regulator